MREYLFRGKRKDNGEWVIGYYFKFVPFKGGKTKCCIQPVREDGTMEILHEVILETVGQYIGMNENNEKSNEEKIFEGDIVEFDYYNYDKPQETYVGEIVYSNDGCCFCLNGNGDCEDIDYLAISEIGGEYKTIITKLGNIQDNPELLE